MCSQVEEDKGKSSSAAADGSTARAASSEETATSGVQVRAK